jgi:hypothetical protein
LSLISLVFFFLISFSFCLSLFFYSFIHTNGGNIVLSFLTSLNEKKCGTTWNPIQYYKSIGQINSSCFYQIRNCTLCKWAKFKTLLDLRNGHFITQVKKQEILPAFFLYFLHWSEHL